MIQITPQMRILVALEPADFRRGIDGLAHLCQQQLQQDPFSGCVFVFRNRRATAVKVLVYDGQGFWLCTSGFPAVAFAGGRPAWMPAWPLNSWRHTSCRCCSRRATRPELKRRRTGGP